MLILRKANFDVFNRKVPFKVVAKPDVKTYVTVTIILDFKAKFGGETDFRGRHFSIFFFSDAELHENTYFDDKYKFPRALLYKSATFLQG